MPIPVRYRVLIAEPARHQIRVQITFPEVPGGRYDLHLPVWSPGSYLVREYARHLSGLKARDGRGRSVPATRTDKATWHIEGARGGLRVEYDLYAFERSVRTNHVTADHAFLSGPATFLYSDRHRGQPAELTVSAPRGWKVATALPERRGRFHARDYDELADSPIEAGHLREMKFEARGTPFRMVVSGHGTEDLVRLRRDLRKIAEVEHDLFGYFPFPSYLTILNLTAATRGGLEHQASAALEWPRLRFRAGEQHEDFLALWAHELFHAWNVKQATPKAFRPYDYQHESPTRLLWWFEGITDYYDELLLCRAGLLTPRRYLDRLGERWERLLDTPGRRQMSVASASFDAWIKFYRPDENSSNSSVSYYEKGHLVGALLDLELRQRTAGRRSLDDVLRRVVTRGVRGLPEDGVREAVAKVSGGDFGPWFARYVDGTDELPLERALKSCGLRWVKKDDAKATADGKSTGAWLGAQFKNSNSRLTLASVATGSPAEQAGLSAHDELIALDGLRIDETSLRERLDNGRPGQRVRFTCFRDEELREVEVELGERRPRMRIAGAKNAGPAERAACESWLGAKWKDIVA